MSKTRESREHRKYTLWLGSMTSSEPLVCVCLHLALTVEPAATLITVLEAVVGFGPPLHLGRLEAFHEDRSKVLKEQSNIGERILTPK